MDLEGLGEASLYYVLKLNQSLYGLKQSSFNWHNKLKVALLSRAFVESLSDQCVFISRDMIILVYVDACILISKDQVPMQKFITSLRDGTEDFVFTDEGTLANYFGVSIEGLADDKGFSMAYGT